MRLLVAGLCLLLSGFSGLVYEIAWIREASLVFGSTTHAVSTVVAVFFAGLALGSWLAGRRPVARPMRAYVMLELGLAAVAVLSPALFDAANVAFGAAYGRVGTLGLAAVRVGLVALILLVPATLMGATLPLFCRQLVVDARRIGTTVAALYALNTLGATAGCLTAGFVLLPELGITGAIRLAAVGNVLAALLAWRTRWSEALPPVEEEAETTGSAPWLPGLLMFGAGFAIVGDEVLWTRYLALLVHHDVYTYTITLGTILLGIVLGAALAARVSDRPEAAYGVFGGLQVGVGLYVMLLTSMPPSFWTDLSGGWVAHLLLLLPPSILSGASFPVAVRMVVRVPGEAARGVGRMAALNTVGGIAGSLLAGFVALPGWGLQRSLHLFTAVSLVCGLAAWLVPASDRRLLLRTGWSAAGVFVWGLTPALTATRVPQDFLAGAGTLIDFREGRAANVAVVKVRDHLELTIDRLWQGQNEKNHQIMAAHLPMLLHPAPADVLVIGVGAGLAPSRFLMHPLERLECVDIEPEVFGLIEAHFDAAWMRDPRVVLIGEDGRNHLRHGRQRYDVISVEVGQTIRPGVGGFYTVDFYREAKARLKPGGVVSQFVPLLYFPLPSFRRALRSFREVFPTAVLFYNKTELLLLGFDAPTVPPLQRDRLASPKVHRDLAFSQWGGPIAYLREPESLAAGLLLGPKGVAALAGDAAPFVDDRPELDYLASELGPGTVLEREVVAAMIPHIASPDVLQFEPEGDRFAAIREGNLRDLRIAELLRSVDLSRPDDATLALLGEAMAIHPDSLEVHLLLGEVHLRRGDAAGAERHFRWALRIEPMAHAAIRGLAFAVHRLGRADEAIPLYQRALTRRDGDATTHNNLGVALAARGQLAAARHHFRKALALDPGYAEAAQNLALAQGAPP